VIAAKVAVGEKEKMGKSEQELASSEGANRGRSFDRDNFPGKFVAKKGGCEERRKRKENNEHPSEEKNPSKRPTITGDATIKRLTRRRQFPPLKGRESC